jgi:hypothetical protein
MASKLKRLPKEWENNSQLYLRQGTDNQNILGVQKLNFPKINDSMKKRANKLNRAFFKGRRPNG